MAGAGLISVTEAQAKLLALATPLGVEEIPLAQSAGRYLAKALIAKRDQPPFDASAMDGYAVQTAPTLGARYKIIGEAGAGHAYSGELAAGEALRIFTGAPVPKGAQYVVIQENTRVEAGDLIITDTGNGPNIRPQGHDFAVGARLEPRRLRPVDLALAAAMNCPEVTVSKRPIVALLATGDELVWPGQTPRADQIIASNNFALKALCESEGAVVHMLPLTPDTKAAHHAALSHALEIADIVVTIGGASVGDHDLIGPVAQELGLDPAFMKVALRPGKPLIAGKLGAKILLGLPGNPVSSLVCAQLFLQPLLRATQGEPQPLPAVSQAVLAQDLPPNGPRAHYMRARFTDAGELMPLASQDSGFLFAYATAEALLIRAPNEGAREKGEQIPYLSL